MSQENRPSLNIHSVEDARNLFDKDQFATHTVGLFIEEAREGYAKVSLKLEDKHLNAGGDLMGGVYYTIADFTFGVAANFNRTHTVTWDSQINLYAPARGDMLFAEAAVLKDGNRMCSCEVKVTDSNGTLNAIALINGCRL